jgi:hypothetical protein
MAGRGVALLGASVTTGAVPQRGIVPARLVVDVYAMLAGLQSTT